MKAQTSGFLLILLLEICLISSSGSLGQNAHDARSKTKSPIQVFILAGQSNAEGHNHIKQYHGGRDPFPSELRDQPQILYWPGTVSLPTNSDLWTTLRVDESGAFGPEIGFAREIERGLPDHKIAIIKFAAGGTGIARSVDYTDYIRVRPDFNDQGRNWHPPTDNRPAGDLYTALLQNIRQAMATLQRQHKPARFAGFLWMQGEHESSISRRMAQDYEKLLAEFINSVRKDLQMPSMPVVIGEVNSHDWAYADITRKAQLEVCRELRRTRLVKTIDLPRVSGDAAHFTADGMLTLGARFAEAMLPLQ